MWDRGGTLLQAILSWEIRTLALLFTGVDRTNRGKVRDVHGVNLLNRGVLAQLSCKRKLISGSFSSPCTVECTFREITVQFLSHSRVWTVGLNEKVLVGPIRLYTTF